MPGDHIHILEAMDIAGGACDGIYDATRGYVMRGGREMENHFECLWDLFRSIPSIETPGVSVLDEYYWLNKEDPNYSLCRATEKQGKDAHTDGKFNLSQKGCMEIMKLFMTKDEDLYDKKIEDVFESSRNKNAEVNDVVYRLIKLIEKNGDSVITDFKIVIDEDGDYVYSVDGTALLRFQADVLGYKTVDKLSEEEKAMTAQELMEYLSRAKGFAIGQYEDPEDRTSPFIVGKGYTKEEWLQMVTIRYAMNLTSFRKYVGTTVATNVSEKTVAVIMENSDQLDGVSIVEDTVRHYIDSKYFAHILGYNGKISSDELTDLNEQVVAEGGSEDAYTINDVVGKSGIESYMETTLQGTKGSEKVVVDNTGKVITILERKEAQPGADVYLTIDKDLTEAVYNIVEQTLTLFARPS